MIMVGVYRMKLRTNEEQKERVRQRVNVKIDEDNYEYYPETEHTETYDNDAYQRVGIYVRVSTDDVHQTMSYELQKKYYEDFVVRHPKWQLVDIYADEGISGTSLKQRDSFNRMIADARAGKLDLIITKSVSRFARNVVDFLGMVRMLAEHNPRIGVFFEAECIYSLNERSQMALSFQATMAEEESRNKSRSMETSLRMRLDHGLPLTPKLLGYTHDEYGKLVPDPDTRHIPQLIFFMYLYGYSTTQIADILTTLGKKTYLGNAKWNASGIVQTLKNERYCGDVFTRKTFTPDVISHRSVKNRGERPRSRYLDEHEAIVSRDDFTIRSKYPEIIRNLVYFLCLFKIVSAALFSDCSCPRIQTLRVSLSCRRNSFPLLTLPGILLVSRYYAHIQSLTWCWSQHNLQH